MSAADPALPEPVAETNSSAGSTEEFPHKVFVGNIPFTTNEEELKDFFVSAGNVREAKIVTRGTRSLGYGFVAFETLEECEEAVAKLSKKELGGREINVEVARPLSTEPKPGKRRGRRSKRHSKKNGIESDDGELITHAEADAADNAAGTASAKNKRRTRKKNRSQRKATKDKYKDKDKDTIAPQGRSPLGEPSKTTVFVTNLPFSMNDTDLLELFSDYKVKSANISLRKGSGRSKGFGFVELESETEQLRLLACSDTIVADGRELSIRVALRDEKSVKPSENGWGEVDKEVATPSGW